MKSDMAKLIGTALVGACSFFPSTSSAHQDMLFIGNGIGDRGDEIKIAHYYTAVEGYSGYPSDWDYSKPPFWTWGPKITTLVEDHELEVDKRPTNSVSRFEMTLAVFIDDGANINTGIKLQVLLYNNSVYQPDPKSLYIAKAQVSSNFTLSGQEFVDVKNLRQLAPVDETYYDWNLTTLNIAGSATNSQGVVNYGTLQVSDVFTNQVCVIGNQTPSTNDLTLNQVSGLEYVLIYGTNGNGSAQIVNGTNLVYTPSASFVGTNNVGVQLNWVDGSVTNNLGSINYQFAVTNQNTSPQASALSVSGPKGLTNSFSFPVSDVDNDPLTVSILQQGANGTAYVTGNTNGYYVPGSSLPLMDSFSYYVSDGQGGFATNIVTVNLTNRPPVALSVTNSGLAGVAIPANLNTSVSDPDAGDTNLTVFVASAPPDGVLNTNGAPTNVVFTSGRNAYGLLGGQYGVTDGHATNYGSFVFAVAPVSRAPELLAIRKRTNDMLEVDALMQQNRSVQVEARFWDVPTWAAVLTNRIPNGDWATNIFWTLTNVPMGLEEVMSNPPPEEGTNFIKYIRLKSVAN